MSLVTRCPRCKTLFRISAEQLQARRGQVRCGRCMQVFDGFATLAAERLPGTTAPSRESLDMLAAAKSAHTTARLSPDSIGSERSADSATRAARVGVTSAPTEPSPFETFADVVRPGPVM